MDDTLLAKVEATVAALRGATDQATLELEDARSERAALDARIEQIESLLVELEHATGEAERTLRTGRLAGGPADDAPAPQQDAATDATVAAGDDATHATATADDDPSTPTTDDETRPGTPDDDAPTAPRSEDAGSPDAAPAAETRGDDAVTDAPDDGGPTGEREGDAPAA